MSLNCLFLHGLLYNSDSSNFDINDNEDHFKETEELPTSQSEKTEVEKNDESSTTVRKLSLFDTLDEDNISHNESHLTKKEPVLDLN